MCVPTVIWLKLQCNKYDVRRFNYPTLQPTVPLLGSVVGNALEGALKIIPPKVLITACKTLEKKHPLCNAQTVCLYCSSFHMQYACTILIMHNSRFHSVKSLLQWSNLPAIWVLLMMQTQMSNQCTSFAACDVMMHKSVHQKPD